MSNDKQLERLFEANKHLATLGSGVVVIAATFMKDIFPAQYPAIMLFVIGLSLILLGASIILSVLGMLAATSFRFFGGSGSPDLGRAISYTRAVTITFVFGIYLFAGTSFWVMAR